MSFDEKLQEIFNLLDEAYDHYFEFSDGYCKTSEGQVSVHYPNYFDRKGGLTEPSIGIYSYVLGPWTSHRFDNIDSALQMVREWHVEEMGRQYNDRW